MITFVYGGHEVAAADILGDPEMYDGAVMAMDGTPGRICLNPNSGDVWWHYFTEAWYLNRAGDPPALPGRQQ